MRFLQILTRCYRRPKMLCANIRALEMQTDHDWVQTMLVDGIGVGVATAQATLANYAPYVRGAYVWVLDDDDCCIRAGLVEECKAIVTEYDPDVIMVRMDHGRRGILPDNAHWQKPPVEGWIGASAYIVRQELFKRHAPAYHGTRYASDFDFINAVFESDPDVYWFDVIASAVQRISMGAPE